MNGNNTNVFNQLNYLFKILAEDILGLEFVEEKENDDIPEEIKKLAELRWQAKINRDWANADKYRDEIIAKGYQLLDSKDGYEIKK